MAKTIEKILITISLLALIFIAGCSNQENTKIIDIGDCRTPYVTIEGNCCLDSNKNNICDGREIVMKNELIEGTPVSEKCDAGSNLECISKKIGINTIKIKFQSRSKNFIKVKEINLPELGCKQDFSNSLEMRYNDAQDFEITCKEKYTTIDTVMIINQEVKNINIRTTGEVYEITGPIQVSNKGHLSGKVEIQ